MARLIDADEALLRNDKMKNRSDVFRSYAKVVIDGTPTIDAVEVVRCKDCKHYAQFLQDNKECRCTIFSGCYDRPYPTEPDDFCSYGERRSDV